MAVSVDPGLAIPLPLLPERVSPGQAYFREKARRRAAQKASKDKGKGREDASQGLDRSLVYAGLENSSILKKLRGLAASAGTIFEDDDDADAQGMQARREPQSVLYTHEQLVSLPSLRHGSRSPPVEELTWHGATLVWSKGSAVFRVYSFSENIDDKQMIQQALFADFEVPALPSAATSAVDGPPTASTSTAASTTSPPSLSYSQSSSYSDANLFGPFHPKTPPPPWSDDNANASASQLAASANTSVQKLRVLVILFPEHIRLYYPTGDHHIIPLQFKVRKLWSLDRGVLLERLQTPKLTVPSWLSSSGRAGEAHQDPLFYTLLDPFDEIKPVSKTSSLLDIPEAFPSRPLQSRSATRLGKPTSVEVLLEVDERIIHVSDRRDGSEPIIVSVNASTGKLSVWAYAQIVNKAEDEINAFRQDLKAQYAEQAAESGLDATMNGGLPATGSMSFRAANGKRRRSSDGQPPPPSSDIDMPISTTANDTSRIAAGSSSSAAQRRASALLDRRKSTHNPDATVAELLGGLAPAGGPPRSRSAGTAAQGQAMRRTSAQRNAALSSGMDRRSSTTRNELSVSLDRMALGGSGLNGFTTQSHPSSSSQGGSQTHSQPSSSQATIHAGQQAGNVTTVVEAGDFAAHERQDRREALLGHGEMERDTSFVAGQASSTEVQSDIYLARLYSTTLANFAINEAAELKAEVFDVSESACSLAILPSRQNAVFLLSVTRQQTNEGSSLQCTPIRQLTSTSILAVYATRRDKKDLLTVDMEHKLSLVTEGTQIIPLVPMQHPTAGTGMVDLRQGCGDTAVLADQCVHMTFSTKLRATHTIVARSIAILSAVLPVETSAALLQRFWWHRRSDDAATDMSALTIALLGKSGSQDSGAAEPLSDWEWMSSQDLDSHSQHDRSIVSLPAMPDKALALCMHALRLQSEEYKLTVATLAHVPVLAPVIQALAVHLQAFDYADAAARDGASFINLVTVQGAIPKAQVPRPYDVYEHLAASLSGPTDPSEPFTTLVRLREQSSMPRVESLDSVCPALSTILHLYHQFSTEQPVRGQVNGGTPAERVVLACAAKYLTLDDIGALCASVVLPIKEAIRQCKLQSPTGWPRHAYALLDRADQMSMTKGPSIGKRREPSAIRRRQLYEIDLFSDPNKVIKPISNPQHQLKRKVKDKASRFSLDYRLDDVSRMLNYTTPLVVKLPDDVQPSEAELPAAQQKYLTALAKRTLALPVGHGMFYYRCGARPRSMGISIPKIELSAKILPSPTFLTITTDALAPEEKTWPYFHSGVATALHVAWSGNDFDASEYALHRPAELNARHGGFLLGLGLTGQIRSLGTYQAFKYLDPKHEFTSIGLLIGLGAAYLGTADPKISSALSVHTSSLHPPSAAELNVSLTLQGAGLVAMGLLHVGTCNRRIADNVLRDMARTYFAGTEHPDACKEAYVIASGFCYGLVMLGRGNDTASASQSSTLDFFRHLLDGGRTNNLPGARKNVDGILDVAVTSPAASIALGLAFLQTNRRDVAELMELPQTVDRLDHVRNDLILLRTTCRHLIMWDDIQCTPDGVEAMMPDFIRLRSKGRERLASSLPADQELAYWNIVAGGCLAIGLKYAGSAKVEAHTVLVDYLDQLVRKASAITVTKSLRSNLASFSLQICINTICVALAAVMAGTGELNVLRRLRVMHGRVSEAISYGSHMAHHMALGLLFLGKGRFTLGTSKVAVASLFCALYPVWPQNPSNNRFHLQALRHLWVLAVEPRCLVAKDVDSGRAVYLRLKFKLEEEENGSAVVRSKHLTAPTLTPSLADIISIESDSPRYWPVILNFRNDRHHLDYFVKAQTLFVKRKAGHLSYAQDARGTRSVFTQPKSEAATAVLDQGISTQLMQLDYASLVNLIASYNASSAIMRTDLQLFSVSAEGDLQTTIQMSAFMTSAILESLMQDKPEALALYRSSCQAFDSADTSSWAGAANLGLIQLLYEDGTFSKLFGTRRSTLLRKEFIDQLRLRTESLCEEHLQDGSLQAAILRYLSSKPPIPKLDKTTQHLLRSTIITLRVPPLASLQTLNAMVAEKIKNSHIDVEQLQALLPTLFSRYVASTAPNPRSIPPLLPLLWTAAHTTL